MLMMVLTSLDHVIQIPVQLYPRDGRVVFFMPNLTKSHQRSKAYDSMQATWKDGRSSAESDSDEPSHSRARAASR